MAGGGNDYFALYRYEEAIQDFTKTIELKNNYFNAHLNRIYAFHRLRRLRDAFFCLEQLIEIAPSNPSVYNARAFNHFLRGNMQEAIYDAEKAILISPEFVAAYITRGNALFCLNRYAEAIASYEKVSALSEDTQNHQTSADKNEKFKNIDTLQEGDVWHETTLATARKIIAELYGDGET